MRFICIILCLMFYCLHANELENGDIAYEEQNYEKASGLYKKACDKGIAEACNSLGYMFATGEYFEINYDKAIKLYQKACDNGDALGCSDLGDMYYWGKGVEQDSSKALKLYEKACDMGRTPGYDNYDILKKELGQ